MNSNLSFRRNSENESCDRSIIKLLSNYNLRIKWKLSICHKPVAWWGSGRGRGRAGISLNYWKYIIFHT